MRVKKDAFPEWFRKWPSVEEESETLQVYEPTVIYGLLQQEEYASALLFGDREAIDARLARQAILTRTDPKPPRVVYVLPEFVLWYDVGGAEVMRAQLRHLAEVSTPRLSVQVIPNGVPHPGNEGAFVLATLRDGQEIALAETAARGIMMDAREDISRLKDRFVSICTQALPTRMSADLISRTIEEKWKT